MAKQRRAPSREMVQRCVQSTLKGNQKCGEEMLQPLGLVPLLLCSPWPAAPLLQLQQLVAQMFCTQQCPSRATFITAFEQDIAMLCILSTFLSSVLHKIQVWPEENHNNDLKELYHSREWPTPVDGSTTTNMEPSRPKSCSWLPPSSLHLRNWKPGLFPVVCASHSAILTCTQRQCVCSTGKNTTMQNKLHYSI